MLGIVAQIISSVSFGVSNVVWKKPLETHAQPLLIFFRTCITFLFFLTITLLFFEFRAEKEASLLAFALSILSFGGLYFFTLAMKHETAAIVSTVNSFSFLIGVLTSVVLLHESIQKLHFISMTLFIASTFILNGKNRQFKLSKGVLYSIASALIWGTTLTLMAIPSKKLGFAQTSLITEISVLLVAFTWILFSKHRFNEINVKRLPIGAIFILAGLSIIGLMGMYFSFERIDAYQVVLVSSIGNLVPVVASRIINKEPITGRLIIASVLSSLGILIFAF